MKHLLKSIYAKPLALYLIVALLAISTFAGPAEAMFIPSAQQSAASPAQELAGRAADMARVQAALETKIIRQQLQDYGLAPDAAMARVASLSDEQLHQLAVHTDALQAGGDGVGLLFSLMIIGLLVVLLVFLVQGRIVIK